MFHMEGVGRAAVVNATNADMMNKTMAISCAVPLMLHLPMMTVGLDVRSSPDDGWPWFALAFPLLCSTS